MKFVLVALVLLIVAPAQARQVSVENKSGATLEERHGRTLLHLPAGTVPLGRGGPCDPCALQGARLVGERSGAALILLVTYASRPRAPNAMCGAGEEEVLNVVSLRPKPHEAFGLLLSSCWNNIDSDKAPVWDARQDLLTAERWTLESSEAPQHLSWRIDPDGHVAAVELPASRP